MRKGKRAEKVIELYRVKQVGVRKRRKEGEEVEAE